MNIIQIQTLKNLTENLFESLERVDEVVSHEVRSEFDNLEEHVNRYLLSASEYEMRKTQDNPKVDTDSK